ncbi:VOC family protein [Phreatobacter stygius]|uniref:VOC family protein n=1 Tax=Phreatobacter stygius TaxID=1940610 RepID=A0A4D7B7A9_9HYPH|nr:VOC family protein [Phreatobacter stygius]QCI64032.1 VOC family protein [Phreatobacter stygius]
MLKLDHLTIIAPSLAEGVHHVRDALGIDMPFGGRHPEMATHNHLLRLGDDIFLEVIAVDPQAERPAAARWFGLDDAKAVRAAWDDGRRLGGWVARSGEIDVVLAWHGPVFGDKRRVSRGDRSWLFAVPPDGALPMNGLAPSLIDWDGRPTPAAAMPDLGARLKRFEVEHPDPARVAGLYDTLGLADPPDILRGTQLRYRAIIETPHGIRILQ